MTRKTDHTVSGSEINNNPSCAATVAHQLRHPMYILEIRNRESQRVVNRLFSPWLWLHNLRRRFVRTGTLQTVREYEIHA